MDTKKQLIRLTIALVALATVTGAVAPGMAVAQSDGPPEPPHRVYGDVVDGNGDAVSGVTVEVTQPDGSVVTSATTDTDGAYEIDVEGLDDGDEITVTATGASVTDSDSETLTYSTASSDRVDLTVSVDDGGGDGGDDTGGDGDDGTGGDGDDGTGGAPSGGGGGGGAGGSADVQPPEPPAGTDIEADETSPLNVDDETDTTTATFGEDNAVAEVRFGFRASGDVNARTLSQEPDETGPAPGAAVAVSQITVSDVLRNSDATVRLRVSQDRLDEIGATGSQLTVFRFADGEWQPLTTTVVEETADGVVVEAETPGFSYFAVSATGEPTAAIDAPSEVEAGAEVTLDASGSETEYGEIVSYDWSVGGESLSGETATATLDEAGDVSVELTVENDAGETNTASATITVAQAGDGTGDDGTGADGSGDGSGSDDGIPGFGPLVALVALVAAALIATRYSN